MDFNIAKSRAEELTKILNDCIDKYYMGNESDVSDYDYDMMMRELSAIEEEFPQLLKEDSPTHRVGGSSDTTFEKVTHTVRMESLQDAFSVDELKDCNPNSILLYKKIKEKDLKNFTIEKNFKGCCEAFLAL